MHGYRTTLEQTRLRSFTTAGSALSRSCCLTKGKNSARQLDVVLERQTLKPCILSENTLLASNFSSARRSSRNMDPGQRNGNNRVGKVVQTQNAGQEARPIQLL